MKKYDLYCLYDGKYFEILEVKSVLEESLNIQSAYGVFSAYKLNFLENIEKGELIHIGNLND